MHRLRAEDMAVMVAEVDPQPIAFRFLAIGATKDVLMVAV
jgi:hypothetical protein